MMAIWDFFATNSILYAVSYQILTTNFVEIIIDHPVFYNLFFPFPIQILKGSLGPVINISSLFKGGNVLI